LGWFVVMFLGEGCPRSNPLPRLVLATVGRFGYLFYYSQTEKL